MPPQVSLRPATTQDLPTLFRQQLDPDSNQMAGTKPHAEAAFRAIWGRILSAPVVEARVILDGDLVAGSINCFNSDGGDHIGYWIDRPYWGRGIATRALSLMMDEIRRRPLHATVVRSNAASIRILQRCGFRLTGYHHGEETERYTASEVATFVLE